MATSRACTGSVIADGATRDGNRTIDLVQRSYLMLHRWLFPVFALVSISLCAQAHSLPPPVATALHQAGISSQNVAVWVQALDADTPDVALNAERPLTPASVMKLVTAFAALERLGPGFTWDTRIAHDGTIQNGQLTGNLYLIGGGDPLLNVDRLWKIFARIHAMGVRHIRGNIVLDGSAMRLPPHDPGAFDGQPLRPYNSGPNALLLNFNTVQLHLAPGKTAGAPVGVAPVPSLRGITFENRITTVAGDCRANWWHTLDASIDGNRVTLNGQLPTSCGPRDWNIAPLSSNDFSAALVTQLWKSSHGNLGGQVRWGQTPESATTLFTHPSVSLAEAVREMNKWSSNVIAHQLLASLALEQENGPDMLDAGARIAAGTLATAGISTQGLQVDNGSGLSRIARIRADTLGALLLTAWQRPWMPEFMSALSLVGIDGTARRRLHDSLARGQAHIKTGAIHNVRAIAGYVLDRHGRRHAIVMIVNDSNAPASRAAQDALIEWVWAGR